RYQTGKVIRVWYGDVEPPYTVPTRVLNAREVARRMAWSVQPGRIRVDLKGEGAQSVELRNLDGKVLAKRDFLGHGPVEIDYAGALGAHLLVWKSGQAQAVAKVVL
ncbi:MAG: hypothetical protein JWP91_3436, partial [Fibrobacteres bacterium]|nr:hypothetical protein [Fibrobacterota bacterium]